VSSRAVPPGPITNQEEGESRAHDLSGGGESRAHKMGLKGREDKTILLTLVQSVQCLGRLLLGIYLCGLLANMGKSSD